MPSREEYEHSSSSSSASRRRTNVPASAPKTREHFLQSQFRFVLHPIEDPTAYNPAFHDPDVLVEWNTIEHVEYLSTTIPNCPICLDELAIPKITRCGHMFCWTCVLRYVAGSSNYWRRCPMCFDSITKKALKSVSIHLIQSLPHEEPTITFQLLRRLKGSLFPVATTHSNMTSLPILDHPDAKYSRIVQATKANLVLLIEEEIRKLVELERSTLSMTDQGYLPFVQEALVASHERLDAVKSLKDNSKISMNLPTEDEDSYTYYQMQTGDLVILHPFNLKCLTYEVDLRTQEQEQNEESLPLKKTLPENVVGKVLEVEKVVMTEPNRKRYRFLAHLPIFSEFYFCEIDLRQYLSPATKKHFRPEFKKRERKRQAKLAALREELQAEEDAKAARVAAQIAKSLEVIDISEFPAVEAYQYQQDEDAPMLSTTNTDTSTTEPPPAVSLFSNITRQNGYYPSLGEATTSSPVAQPATGAWGKKPENIPEPLVKQKKKGKIKKGSSLFPNHQRGSYSR